MNSIARALNNIALSLNSIAAAINNSKKLELKTTPITSNPTSNVTITSTAGYQDSLKKASIPLEEKAAIDSIYDALTIKGSHPHHHDDVMQELSKKWPVLYKALSSFVRVRESSYNQKYSSNIWKDSKKNTF